MGTGGYIEGSVRIWSETLAVGDCIFFGEYSLLSDNVLGPVSTAVPSSYDTTDD